MPHIDETETTEAKVLWRPSSPENTQIHDFMTSLNQKHDLSLDDYNALWEWSVSEPAKFWEEIWHHSQVKAHEPYTQVSICIRYGRHSALWQMLISV